MNTEIKKCPHGDKLAFGPGRSIDAPITQAFHQFQMHSEKQALDLAVRLRVLGKSLASGCPGRGVAGGKEAEGFQSLRRQLDNYLLSLVDHGFEEHPYFPTVCHCLRESLPSDLNGCAGEHCSIERVETFISLLSERNRGGEDVFPGESAPSLSL
ncbi:hypothetical protein [Desulfuromonas soudanensis]|nr:hypothetical protein [Desulfuromonas soudanensis]